MQRYAGKGWIGLNQNQDPTLIGDDEFSDCSNVRICDDGGVDARNGWTAIVSSVPSQVVDAIQVYSDGQKQTFYATDTTIYRIKSDGTAETVLSGLHGSGYGQFFQFDDSLFFTNNVDNIQRMRLNQLKYQTALVSDSISVTVKYISSLGYPFVSFTVDGDFSSIVPGTTLVCVSDESANVVRVYVPFSTTGSDKPDGSSTFYGRLIKTISVEGARRIFGYRESSTTAPYFYVECYETSTHDATNLRIKKYTTGGTLVATLDVGAIAGWTDTTLAGLAVTANGVYFGGATNSVQKYALDLTTPTNSGSAGKNGVTADLSYVYIVEKLGATSAAIYRLNASTMASVDSTTVTLTIYDIRNAVNLGDTIGFEVQAFSGGAWVQYLFDKTTLAIVGQNLTGGNSSTDPDYTLWHDVATPEAPDADETADAGNVSGTNVTYRLTFAGYEGTTKNFESSVGDYSWPITTSAKKVEVSIPFDRPVLKAKADQMLITHYRVYRADSLTGAGTRLVATLPIYVNSSVALTTGDTTLTVSDALNTTYTDNLYLIIDDEIVKVTAISGTAWTIVRAQKGTTAAAHLADKPAYLFSYIDDIADASYGVNGPTENDILGPCKFLTTYSGSVVYGGPKNAINRIWYSGFDTDRADPDIIVEDAFHEINPNDGDELRGACTFQNSLFLFKERSAWVLSGDIDADIPLILPFDATFGAVGHKSIVQYRGGWFIMSRAGLLYLSGNGINNISRKHLTTLWDSINWDYADRASMVVFYDKQELWVSVPTSSATTPNKTIVLNLKFTSLTEDGPKSFVIYGFGRGCLRNYTTTAGASAVMGGMATALVREDSGTADGTTVITSYFVTKDYNFGFPLQKTLRRMMIDHYGKTSGETLVEYAVDGGSYSTASSFAYTTASRTYSPVSITGKGKRVKFKFSNASNKILTKIFNFIFDFKLQKAGYS